MGETWENRSAVSPHPQGLRAGCEHFSYRGLVVTHEREGERNKEGEHDLDDLEVCVSERECVCIFISACT